ncbi:MAG: F0F1 ATP synthase subunit B [Chloroflexota bacterium]
MAEISNQLGINWTGLLSQAVNFIIVLLLLRRFLYEPLFNMMEQRKERIASSMKDAERASSAAAEAEQERAKILEEARREAQEVRAQATRDAEKIAQEVRGRAEQEATEIRMKAQEDAQAQAETALADVNKQVADLAIQATEKLLGRALEDQAEQQRFVTDFLEQKG